MSLKTLLTQENVGGWDLWARALLGSVAITVLAIGMVPAEWELLVALVAVGGLFTSITRHCTPYSFLHFTTAKKR